MEAKLTLFDEYLAIQRVRRLVHCVNVTNFLTFLLGQSFKKVYALSACFFHTPLIMHMQGIVYAMLVSS